MAAERTFGKYQKACRRAMRVSKIQHEAIKLNICDVAPYLNATC